MKKLLSISFAFLILLSGMHLSVATHICGGEIAAVKLSLSGTKATCGMETPKQTCPGHSTFKNNCCKDEIAVLITDSNYNSSTFQAKEVIKNMSQTFAVPVNTAFNSHITLTSLCTFISPPDNLLASDVSLSEICIFRI